MYTCVYSSIILMYGCVYSSIPKYTMYGCVYSSILKYTDVYLCVLIYNTDVWLCVLIYNTDVYSPTHKYIIHNLYLCTVYSLPVYILMCTYVQCLPRDTVNSMHALLMYCFHVWILCIPTTGKVVVLN